MRLFQIDAFTSRRFHGNPAAVVPLEVFPDDARLQAIAEENRLSETAFFTKRSDRDADFNLRWFTPAKEVDLCGHATLATAHALWEELGHEAEAIRFDTRSGVLTVTRKDGRYAMDFPAIEGERVEATTDLVRALGREPDEVYRATNLMCVYGNKREVHEIDPDFPALARMGDDGGPLGVIVTATGAGHDIVSRYFAPWAGVPEDPATGSAHCMLTPFWARRLGKRSISAHQVSKRGGELWCRYDEDRGRVELSGHAVTYLRGEIEIG